MHGMGLLPAIGGDMDEEVLWADLVGSLHGELKGPIWELKEHMKHWSLHIYRKDEHCDFQLGFVYRVEKTWIPKPGNRITSAALGLQDRLDLSVLEGLETRVISIDCKKHKFHLKPFLESVSAIPTPEKEDIERVMASGVSKKGINFILETIEDLNVRERAKWERAKWEASGKQKKQANSILKSIPNDMGHNKSKSKKVSHKFGGKDVEGTIKTLIPVTPMDEDTLLRKQHESSKWTKQQTKRALSPEKKSNYKKMKSTVTEDTPLVLKATEKRRIISQGEEPSLEEAAKDRKKFVQLFGRYYHLGLESVFHVNIKQMKQAKAYQVTRPLEDGGVALMKKYLVQTPPAWPQHNLCLMPKLSAGQKWQEGMKWDDIKDGQFIIIDGQHTVAASRQIIAHKDTDNALREKLKVWPCTIVWTEDSSVSMRLSFTLNNFNKFSPTWTTQILYCRRVWLKLGRPQKQRSNAAQDPKNGIDWKNFTTSMEAAFTAISRGITHADLNAELTIIMAPDETSKLWKKIFIGHEKGELVNPDKPGRTYLDDHMEMMQKHKARHKTNLPFEEKPYICKPLTRETFKAMGGLTRSDYHLAARRILEVREGVPKVTIRSTKNPKVTTLKSWCNFRKWKNILLQELSTRDPKKLGIWGKDLDGFDRVNRDVWKKFKKEHGITKAKWVKLFEVASDTWLNKKRTPNNKYLKASPACDRLLMEWLQTTNIGNCSQITTRWVSYNAVKKHLVMPNQDHSDVEWLSKSIISAGLIDFRFIPGCVDQPVPNAVVESLLKYITNPLWSPGVKMVPAWMIISDAQNHEAATKFIYLLCQKHPGTFINVPSFYFPCLAEDLPSHKEIESKRTSPALYVDFLTCTNIFPRFKIFPCPMLAPQSRTYEVNPKHWSELSYELSRGELRMEVYLTFLSYMGYSGGVVINFFGGLKPIAASLMNDFNVFSYLDSTFIHILREKIAHVRPLRATDFVEYDVDGEESLPRPLAKALPSSPLHLEDVTRVASPPTAIDNMDMDEPHAEDNYEEANDDNEAPSEKDSDDATNKGDFGDIDIQSQEYNSILQAQSMLNISPLQGTMLDKKVADDVHEAVDVEADKDHGNEHDHADDHVEESDHEDEDVQDGYNSEGNFQSFPFEDSEDQTPPSPPRPGPPTKPRCVSTMASKDWQRNEDGPREPFITESFLEDKIVGILSKTLPQIFSGLIQEAMGQSKHAAIQAKPFVAAVAEVPMPSPPHVPLIQVGSTTQGVAVEEHVVMLDIDESNPLPAKDGDRAIEGFNRHRDKIAQAFTHMQGL